MAIIHINLKKKTRLMEMAAILVNLEAAPCSGER
jgi:hypothetical protein